MAHAHVLHEELKKLKREVWNNCLTDTEVVHDLYLVLRRGSITRRYDFVRITFFSHVIFEVSWFCFLVCLKYYCFYVNELFLNHMDLKIHAKIRRNTLLNMLGSIPHQKFCFYHLPTRGRAGIKLRDASYVSNVSIIFYCSMLLYYQLWMFYMH